MRTTCLLWAFVSLSWPVISQTAPRHPICCFWSVRLDQIVFSVNSIGSSCPIFEPSSRSLLAVSANLSRSKTICNDLLLGRPKAGTCTRRNQVALYEIQLDGRASSGADGRNEWIASGHRSQVRRKQLAMGIAGVCIVRKIWLTPRPRFPSPHSQHPDTCRTIILGPEDAQLTVEIVLNNSRRLREAATANVYLQSSMFKLQFGKVISLRQSAQ